MEAAWHFRLETNLSGCLDDNRDGQVDVVRVDQAHRAPSVAGKGGMNCIMRQHLRQRQLSRTFERVSSAVQGCRRLVG